MAPHRLSALLCALVCSAAGALAQPAAREASTATASRAAELVPTARADAAASGGICRVSSSTDSGAGSLRAALADPGCTSVLIAAGTTIVLESQLDIVTSVVISCDVGAAPFDLWSSIGGGGASTPLKCVLDGARRTRIMYAETTSPGLHLTLKGLTLRNGAALEAAGLGDSAGAIYFRPPGGVLTIEGCTFVDNEALFLGGAIRTKNTADVSLAGITLTIRDSTFERNTAGFGGAVSTGTRTTFQLERTSFLRNSAVSSEYNNGFSGGGAVSSGGTQLRAAGVTFDGNAAGDNGGALDVVSSCPFDFGPTETFQQEATAEVAASLLARNRVGAAGAGDVVFGGAVSAEGCTYATPAGATPLPRTMLRLSDASFSANAALGTEAYGGAVATAYGVSTLLAASAFDADADACSPRGALYLNVFSSEGTTCADTLSVQAQAAPACDAWAPLGVAHGEAGSAADGTRQTCVPLAPAKQGAFCCAPSLEAPALVCPLAPAVPADATCAATAPRQGAAEASLNKAADAALRLFAARKGSAME